MSFSMFTDEGDRCVADAYANVTSRDFPLSVTAREIVELVQQETIQLGKARGIKTGEVYDTAVRESIWEQLERDVPSLISKVVY